MTFEELLRQIAYDYKHPAQTPDGRSNADRNGNMRLSELQKKYGLSSLKIQKLLVTAGVYQPVKKDANYDRVKSLYESGKSMQEIMEETYLSKATVNGFLPYERGMTNADAFNIEVDPAADRKRKQRHKEEQKKAHFIRRLDSYLSDDTLWDALAAHEEETFVSTSGQKFSVKVVYQTDSTGQKYTFDDKASFAPELIIICADNTYHISRKELLDAFHNALEIKAKIQQWEISGSLYNDADTDLNHISKISTSSYWESHLGAYYIYLKPLFTFFDILPGNIDETTTRRIIKKGSICSCCGRETSELFKVSSFEDLIELDKQFRDEWEAELAEKYGDQYRRSDSFWDDRRAYYEDKKKALLNKARDSRSVIAFNSEGTRTLCKLCAETIYMALEEGEIPPASPHARYDDLSENVLFDYIDMHTETAHCDYFQALFGKYHASDFDSITRLLHTAVDRENVPHHFALTVTDLPYEDDSNGLLFRALEVHKMTKAGKIAKDSTSTDYDINHFKHCYDNKDYTRMVYVGIIELMDKITDVLNAQTLDELHFPASNLITVDGRHYGIQSIGTIMPVYVEDPYDFRSMEGREWDGGDCGFLIDGKLFSGKDLALIFSGHQGFQIQYVCESDSDDVLRNGEYLMRVNLSEQALIDETTELINMFTQNGAFTSDRDKENFEKLFNKDVLSKFKAYHNSRPHGYGKLAAMSIIKVLQLIEGSQSCQDKVRALIQ